MLFFLGVEGIAGDEGSGELAGGVLIEQALCDGEFAIVFFSAVGALGEGLTGGVEAEGHDAAKAAFGSEVFAVQGEGFGKVFAVGGEPGVKCAGEFDRANAVDDVVDRAVSGHDEEPGFFVLFGEADGSALVLVKRSAFVPNGFDVVGSANQPVDDEGEHGAEGVAKGFGIAGVGEIHEGFAQGTKFTALEGAACSGGVAFGDGGLVGRWQEAGAGEEAEGRFFEGTDPELFGFSEVLVEVAAVSFISFGEAEGQPVGRFVKGAGVLFGVVKAFGHEGGETVAFLELLAEGAQGEGEALAGEIGAAGAVDDVETAELDDEFEAVGASDGIPTDVLVAFLEAFGSATPAEDGYQFGEAGIAVGAVNPLPENVPGRAACFEIMVLVEDAAEVVDLGFFNGRADDQGVSFKGGLGHQCFHSNPTLRFWGGMSRIFS